jgi:hypothetical protein
MPNLFWIPNSPIKSWTVQTSGPILERGVPSEQVTIPSFLGYGTRGGLSRFKVFLPSLRDTPKRHPASVGKRKGINNPSDKKMDISARFVGNFIISGTVRDATNTAINNCTVKLFRTNTDTLLLTTSTNSGGVFTFSLPNDSYKSYYLIAVRTDMANTAGITSYSIRPVQI